MKLRFLNSLFVLMAFTCSLASAGAQAPKAPAKSAPPAKKTTSSKTAKPKPVSVPKTSQPAAPVAEKPATPAVETKPATDSGDTKRIAKEDTLLINVVDHPELSQPVAVLTDGTIHYPFLGENNEMYVVGLTLVELQRKIQEALANQYVRPKVVVSMTGSAARTMTMLGSGVRTPGPKVMREGWRILDALAETGGVPMADRPELYRATLFRRNGADRIPVDLTALLDPSRIDQSKNFLLEKGDILFIEELAPDETTVTVLGEVAQPGPKLLQKDGSILRTLSQAGGPTPKASLAGVTITRRGQSIPVDLRDMYKTGIEPTNVRLRAGDVVNVPENKKRYYLLAPVSTAGANVYPEDEKLTLFSGLTRAGIVPQNSDFKNVVFIKTNPDGTEKSREKIDIDKMFKDKKFEQDRPLDPGDIVYVPGKTPKQPVRLLDVINVALLGLTLVNQF